MVVGMVKMRPDRTLVQVQLSRDLVRLMDHIAIEHDEFRASIVEVLIRAGLEAHECDIPSCKAWRA